MPPAAVHQDELVQPMRERQAAQADVKRIGHGEVRQPQAARWVFLCEADLPLFAVLGAPLAATPPQGAQHRFAELLGVAALKLLQQRHGHQRRRAFQHRHHLFVPERSQRVGASAPVARWALRGKHRSVVAERSR